jgi:hypothetical protein
MIDGKQIRFAVGVMSAALIEKGRSPPLAIVAPGAKFPCRSLIKILIDFRACRERLIIKSVAVEIADGDRSRLVADREMRAFRKFPAPSPIKMNTVPPSGCRIFRCANFVRSQIRGDQIRFAVVVKIADGDAVRRVFGFVFGARSKTARTVVQIFVTVRAV